MPLIQLTSAADDLSNSELLGNRSEPYLTSFTSAMGTQTRDVGRIIEKVVNSDDPADLKEYAKDMERAVDALKDLSRDLDRAIGETTKAAKAITKKAAAASKRK